MLKLLGRLLVVSFVVSLIFILPKLSYASTIASQTADFSWNLSVWQVLQELGSNLEGPVGSFTFRIYTPYNKATTFDYTAGNTKIYDKDALNAAVARGCVGGTDVNDRSRGLKFNKVGVPEGFEDVTIDFSCNNYSFIPGHRYLIFITGANMPGFGGGKIPFATAVYYNTTKDYFTGGGLRYAFDNRICDPQVYTWNAPINDSGCNIFSSKKDDLYFILKDAAPDNQPDPFLNLPWDYQNKGLSFTEAALAINSYFDHEYPLLSSGLDEPEGGENSIIYLWGGDRRFDLDYSSHDGYDYGKPAKVGYGDPILAAADGTATYMNSCSACGNAIFIDHGNGYQTRYYHLQKDGLIINVLGQKVQVSAGQPIGKNGATGNVFPSGEQGAHIHFMVVQDKNKDGNFEDNLPDGITDPFGWQSKESDPWENYSFFYSGENRTGNKSFYLWKNKLDSLDAALKSSGGVFNIGKSEFNFPQGATNQDLNLSLQSSPQIQTNNLVSIGSAIVAEARDLLENIVIQFNSLFTLTIDFAQFDLSNINTDTLSIYSSSDGINWSKEQTLVDLNNKKATTTLNHFTHFALLAEEKDTIPASTSAYLTGEMGQPNWFRSKVTLTLNSIDNAEGLGIDYILYKLPGEDWESYTSPLVFSSEGSYKVEFYSVDKGENIEDLKSVEFNIDKTSPEAKIYVDPDKQDITVAGIDENKTVAINLDNPDSKNKSERIYEVTDPAGNNTTLSVKDIDKDNKDQFRVHNIRYGLNLNYEQQDNFYKVSYKKRGDKQNIDKQSFEVKKDIKITIEYDVKNNQSTITTKEFKADKVKEVREGFILLYLQTENGTLKYGY